MTDDWNTDRPGRVPVLIATIGLFLMEVPGLLIDPGTRSIVRLLLAGGLAIAVYHRHNWARWLVLVLVGLATLFIVYLILNMPMPLIAVYVLVLAALIYLGIIALLFVPSWGGKYFRPGPGDPVR
ncbi:MAG: hypothetical protein QNI99_05135 [Woeseiaceae bacterium]|nr:hypothetical protein [Woeseiaceae bacterium]